MLEDPDVWNDPDRAQKLGRERAQLEAVVKTIADLDAGLSDARELLEMARDEEDADTVAAVESDLSDFTRSVEKLEFQRMFSGETDACNAFLDIQAGSGGT